MINKEVVVITMSRYEEIVDYWRQKSIKNSAKLAEILNGKMVLFAFHSGKIENSSVTFHDTREIFEHDGVTNYSGDLRTLFEIRNAKDASELFLKAFSDYRPLDETLIKEFHYELAKNTYDSRRWQLGERPGEYKKHDYATGKNEIGASPEDVAEEMQELLEEFTNLRKDNLITTAAYFHTKFENIHPFADGNGRVGRIAMNYLLIINNHPPVIIHEEDRKEYYTALEEWDENLSLEPMKSFLEYQLLKTWEKQV